MKATKKISPATVIMKRELSSYFTSPIAYIVTALFLLASGFLFFNTFFLYGRAELRNFFAILPITLSFFIPALTMRAITEEKRSGSMETLLTLPVTHFQVILGKYLAVFITGLVMISPTLFYAITCYMFGTPDAGPILGGYLGAVFLIASFCAIGLFASSTTKNQIIAFFIGFTICIVLTLISQFSVLLPAAIVKSVAFISCYNHFESISRGIIDTRDLVYFISLTVLFIALTVETLKASGDKK